MIDFETKELEEFKVLTSDDTVGMLTIEGQKAILSRFSGFSTHFDEQDLEEDMKMLNMIIAAEVYQRKQKLVARNYLLSPVKGVIVAAFVSFVCLGLWKTIKTH